MRPACYAFRVLKSPMGRAVGTSDTGGSMQKILVVEDDELGRNMLVRRLERRGYAVVVAADGVEAINIAQSEEPDLILMDLSLPAMDGWEAVRRLKSDPQLRDIPIIALTAHALEADREEALAAGCDDYDTKPINMRRLIVKINQQLT